MKHYLITFFLLLFTISYGQQNCNIYKWEDNMPCYEACELYTKKLGQGSRASQENYDAIIELCPDYDDAHWAKAIPYLKRGDFVTWKKMIDHAVTLSPEKHLGYRGWCRYQFLRDYEGAIKDIEALDELVNYDIGFCQNGDYHLNVALALCYKGKGDNWTAIKIIENHLTETNNHVGIYDFLHLGVLYLEEGEYEKSIDAIHQQLKTNEELAENYYYLAMAYKGLNKLQAHKKHIQRAWDLYQKDLKRTDTYTHPMDKVYLKDIKKEYTDVKMG